MDYGLDTKQFRLHVVRPVLTRIKLWSTAAENLVMGTAQHESHLRYIDQVDKADVPGPAFGVCQMERRTHEDIYRNFLGNQRSLKRAVVELASYFVGEFPDATEMTWNLAYAVAMCRVFYRRVDQALPSAQRPDLLCQYWKTYYNTRLGRGTIEQALPHFEHAVKEGSL